jgi:hypothetical protein
MKLDLIEQPTKSCDVCAAETDPEDAFCQECGVSLSRNELEPETLTAKISHLQKTLSERLPKMPPIPGMPKLPTAVPAFIGLALLAGAVTWCIQRIDTSFDTFSEDYISSAALKALKKHNTTEAAELLLRFHLEHSGKMTAEHLLMLGQYLTMRADEAIQTKDYSTAINYLQKVSNDCPQYTMAQTKLRDLKERGLTVTATVQSSPVVAAPPIPVAGNAAPQSPKTRQETASSKASDAKAPAVAASKANSITPGAESAPASGASTNENTYLNQSQARNPSESKNGQNLSLAPQVMPQSRPSDPQESKLRTSVPIWQRFSRGVTISKGRTSVGAGAGGGGGGGSGIVTSSNNAASHISRVSDWTESGNRNGGGSEGGSERGSERRSERGSERGSETGSARETKSAKGTAGINGTNNSVIHPGLSSASDRATAENERDKPKVSGFFIDGKPVAGDSRSQELEKSPEKVAETARRAGPQSHPAGGQKSYNPDDISRYNELLANYFSQHDAASQKSTDKHASGAEPPSFQEWISKGRPGFR